MLLCQHLSNRGHFCFLFVVTLNSSFTVYVFVRFFLGKFGGYFFRYCIELYCMEIPKLHHNFSQSVRAKLFILFSVRSGEEPIRFVSSNFLYTYIQITPYKHKRARIISRLGGIPPRREKNFLFPPAGPPREHCPSPYSNLPSPLYSLLNSSSRARGSPSSEPLSEELSSESGSSGLELSIPILLGASGMHATSSMLD